MTRFAMLKVVLIAYFCTAGTATAALYRLDFSGTLFGSNEIYSGYAILDYNTPNTSSNPNRGYYDNAVIQFELEYGSNSHTLDPSTETGAVVLNDDDYSNSDIFSISLLLIDQADGSEVGQFIFQLIDPSMTVFSDIELPTSLSIEDFDPTINQSGVLLVNVTTDYFNPIDFVQLTPVPLPAGILLLLSGLSTFFALGYRRRSQ